METGILERIRLIMKEYKLSERQFALQIGVTPSVINTMFQRKQDNVKLSTIANILNTFQDIDVEWLVEGKGEMYRKIVNANADEDVSLLKEIIKNLNYTIQEQKKKIEYLERTIKNNAVAVLSDDPFNVIGN